ncbi:MAG: hypothetical protein ACOCW8_01345, partial [bacterium]
MFTRDDAVWYLNEAERIHYYHHDLQSHDNLLPANYDSNKFITFSPSGIDNTFDSITSCPITPTKTKPLQLLIAEKDDAQQQYDETEVLLQSTVDNGSTELLTQEVEMTNELNAFETYNHLMETSPYLSEEVLTEVSEKEDGLNNAMIRDVLVENPQAAKSEVVEQTLDERIDQLPAYMRWQIRNGLFQLGEKEAMEMHKSYQKLRRDKAIKEMLYH